MAQRQRRAVDHGTSAAQGFRKKRPLHFTPWETTAGPGSSAHEEGQAVQKDEVSGW